MQDGLGESDKDGESSRRKRRWEACGERRAGTEAGGEWESSSHGTHKAEGRQMAVAALRNPSARQLHVSDDELGLNMARGGDEALWSLAKKEQEVGQGDGAAGRSIGEIIPGACQALMAIADELAADLAGLRFGPPVTCVYNPLIYARDLYGQYVCKHGGKRLEVLLVGMNPGPFGMAQTGVPFGDSTIVQEFHGITGKVGCPDQIHPRRLIYGLQCPRNEVSGQRLWGWARDRFHHASNFFSRFWVYNYCPLVFMEASGRNRTPDKLQPNERSSLNAACDRALFKTIDLLQPQLVIGVGKYATERIRTCAGVTGVKIGEIMHPSPANPKANKDWSKIIESQLNALGVIIE